MAANATASFGDARATTFRSALYRMNSAVIGTNDLVLVADPGFLPGELEELRLHVGRIRGSRPLYVLFTHSDFDHIAGFGAFPDAVTIASEAFAERTDRERIMRELKRYDDEFYIDRPYEPVYPRVDLVIRQDGETLTVGGTTLRFLLAPGHTADGLMASIEPAGVLVAGDYMSDIEFPFVCDGFAAYRRTLDKLRRLIAGGGLRMLVPGHGTPACGRAEMERRAHDSLAYLDLAEAEAVTGSREPYERFAEARQYRYRSSLDRSHESNLALLRNAGR